MSKRFQKQRDLDSPLFHGGERDFCNMRGLFQRVFLYHMLPSSTSSGNFR